MLFWWDDAVNWCEVLLLLILLLFVIIVVVENILGSCCCGWENKFDVNVDEVAADGVVENREFCCWLWELLVCVWQFNDGWLSLVLSRRVIYY